MTRAGGCLFGLVRPRPEARQAVTAGRLTLPDGNRPVSQTVELALFQLCSAFCCLADPLRTGSLGGLRYP
jgi:hypothetical protein